MSTTKTVCDNCSAEITERSIGFTAKLEGTNVIVGDALRRLMFRTSPVAGLTPLKTRHEERRVICRSCMFNLRKLHKAFEGFFPPTGTNSYIKRKMDIALVEEDSEIKDAEISKRTRVVKRKNKNQPKTRSIKVGHLALLRLEARRMAAHSQLLNGNKTMLHVPNWKKVDAELQLIAPNLRKVIIAAGGAKQSSNLNPQLGAALSILLNSRNRSVNRFQCCVSFLLARTRATKQVRINV